MTQSLPEHAHKVQRKSTESREIVRKIVTKIVSKPHDSTMRR